MCNLNKKKPILNINAMKKLKSDLLRTLVLLFSFGMIQYAVAQKTAEAADVLKLIEKVNDYWQANNSPLTRSFWDHAAYHTGNMEAYKLTGKAAYYDYSARWCDHNHWRGANSDDKRNWKYKTYGEGQDFVLFGDWQICFQTYIDMYELNPADYKVARAKEVMSYACHMNENKFWWWSDALYMVMPVMTKMYKLTGDKMYLDRLYENYLWSDSLMYDPEDQLYYRDAKYIFPKVKTAVGGKSFWARGDGWVLAGLAKVLADMPEDYAHRDFFVKRFKELAEGVARCQQPAGYWSRSMLCEADAPGPETSGTGFFAYGLMWGVNHGLLDRARFAPTIEKAWGYLSGTALQADGSIGFVQPIGEKPDPTKNVDARSQAPFGTGAWLLAACERVRYLDATVNAGQEVSVGIEIKNTTKELRTEVVELDAQTVFGKLGIAGGRQFVVFDSDRTEVPYQLTHDGKLLLMACVRPGTTVNLTVRKGIPSVFKFAAFGRVYPNREDDLSWENDRNGWRAYGPAIQKSGQHIYGFDVFTKNQPYPMLETLYHGELMSYGLQDKLRKAGRGGECAELHRTLTYHRDHGYGMDAYTVGSTLGAGVPALLDGDDFVYPRCYKDVEILENGPLRFSVRMNFAPVQVGNDEAVAESRVVTLDKGTHLNKCEVTYTGLEEAHKVAAGIVVHNSDPEAYVTNKKAGYVAYADALDHPEVMNGQVFIGCLFPNGLKAVKYIPLAKEAAGGVGHVTGICNYNPGDTFTYYFGSAWSKYDMPDMNVWQSMLEKYARNLKNPLEVVVE